MGSDESCSNVYLYLTTCILVHGKVVNLNLNNCAFIVDQLYTCICTIRVTAFRTEEAMGQMDGTSLGAL